MRVAPLPLKDIHLPDPPGWWPPAPGWWVLAALILFALVWMVRRLYRSRRRQARIARSLQQFDRAIAAADGSPARLAAASVLLRRAARLQDPAAAVLIGQDWLAFLDGDDPTRPFSHSAGAMLIDGAFRADIDADVAPALAIARTRFATLLVADSARATHA
jgi:hypothetical protein